MSNPKLTADSKFATYLRALIRRKKQNPDLAIRYIPFTSKPKFRYKKKQAHEIIGIPSIYIPPEVKKTDLSDIFYPQEYFETRAEKEERLSIERELEHETDPVKRDDLRKQLNLEKYHIKVRKELLALMPIRHKMIRDTLMRGRDRPKLVLDFLKELEPSESYVKSILPPHEYKHFSDDYPEVQILLQNAEQEKAKKSKLTAKMYKEYGYGFGEVYEDITKSTEADAFDPFPGKEGKSSQLPTPRINVKFLENEKERTERKETKLNKKKVEKKNKENLIKSRRPKRENVSTIEGNTITIQ